MTRFGAARTVQRLPWTHTTRNAHGRDTHHRGGPVDLLAGFDPGDTSEVDGRLVVTVGVLFVDPAIEVHRLDQWVIDGDRFDVVGGPTRVRNDFTGAVFDTEIELRRVVGS